MAFFLLNIYSCIELIHTSCRSEIGKLSKFQQIKIKLKQKLVFREWIRFCLTVIIIFNVIFSWVFSMSRHFTKSLKTMNIVTYLPLWFVIIFSWSFFISWYTPLVEVNQASLAWSCETNQQIIIVFFSPNVDPFLHKIRQIPAN